MTAIELEEQQRRRVRFGSWLMAAWDAASDAQHPAADAIAELLSHADEPDYPIWEMAEQKGIVGNSNLATVIRAAVGAPVKAPRAPNGWERDINFSPVIMLDESVWRAIHGALGWVNRDTDSRIPGQSFYLWSNAGNPVAFVIRQSVIKDT